MEPVVLDLAWDADREVAQRLHTRCSSLARAASTAKMQDTLHVGGVAENSQAVFARQSQPGEHWHA